MVSNYCDDILRQHAGKEANMILDFTYDENYLKSYMPEALNTEVFDFYVEGLRHNKAKDVVQLRRQPSESDERQHNQFQIVYNGEPKTADDPLKMHVEGVVIDDYLDRDTWNVIITIPNIKKDGIPVEAIIPGGDFSDKELFGLYQLKDAHTDFGEFLGDSEAEQLFKSLGMESIYIRLSDTMHMCKDTAYGTDRGLYVSVGEKVKLYDEGSYCVNVRTNGLFSGGQQSWLCRYPIGRWKENKDAFRRNAKGISANARGSRLNVSMIFDEKYLIPDEEYEYRLFKISER